MTSPSEILEQKDIFNNQIWSQKDNPRYWRNTMIIVGISWVNIYYQLCARKHIYILEKIKCYEAEYSTHPVGFEPTSSWLDAECFATKLWEWDTSNFIMWYWLCNTRNANHARALHSSTLFGLLKSCCEIFAFIYIALTNNTMTRPSYLNGSPLVGKHLCIEMDPWPRLQY